MRRSFLPLAAALLLTVAPLAAVAQPHHAGRPHGPHDAGTHRMVHTWFADTVAPVLRSWQASYDATLPAADREALVALRTRAAALRSLWVHDRGQRPTAGSAADDRSARRDTMRTIMQELRPILERNAPALKALLEEHHMEIQAWRDRLHAVVAPPENGTGDTVRHRRHHRGPGHLPIPFGHKHRRHGVVAFVLWNGAVHPAPAAGQPFQSESTTGLDETSALPPTLTVSPTPSTSTAYLRASGLPDGPATVEVRSMNGELLQSVPVTILDGAVSLPLTVDALANGSYMASVRTPSGRRTTHLIVQH